VALAVLFVWAAFPSGYVFGYLGSILVLPKLLGGMWDLDLGFTLPGNHRLARTLSLGCGFLAAALAVSLVRALAAYAPVDHAAGPRVDAAVLSLLALTVCGALGLCAVALVCGASFVALAPRPPG